MRPYRRAAPHTGWPGCRHLQSLAEAVHGRVREPDGRRSSEWVTPRESYDALISFSRTAFMTACARFVAPSLS